MGRGPNLPPDVDRAQRNRDLQKVRNARLRVGSDRFRYHGASHNGTDDDYQRMLEAQGGRCWFCRRTEEEEGRRLAIDHNHETRKLRKLLCFRCNVQLAWFEQHQVAAIEYLGLRLAKTKKPGSVPMAGIRISPARAA